MNKTGIIIVCGCVLVLFIYVLSKNSHETPSTEKSEVNLKDVLKTSISAAVSGGVQILSTNDAKIELKGKTKEGANDSVTSADYKSHCAMNSILKFSFPNLNIISEEDTNCEQYSLTENTISYGDDVNNLNDVFVNHKDITVWIDPLDATKEFTEKLDKFVTTMVCVAVKGHPIIGVIHKPFLKETYWGWVGNGQSSNINAVPEEKTKTVIISRSHSGNTIHDLIKTKFPDYSIVEAGGAGYKVLELVKGTADVYIHMTAIKKWDICAGNAILDSLSGKLTTSSGKNISYSYDSGDVIEDGLVVALKNHDFYLKQL